MKTKYLINFIALGFLIIGSAILIGQTFAQETIEAANIQYPVEELSNCEDEVACRSYCDEPENNEVCFDFAQKNNLMSEEEVKAAKNFLAIDENGPGECKGKEECEKYCSNTNHIDECISFAEENNLIPPEELEEAKKVQAAIKRGFKPPPCGNKKQCDIYCDQPEHMEECVTFGIEAGFIQGKELEDVKKMLAAIKRGVKAPPCKGKEACDEYCSNPDNMELCMNFAMEAGFMNEQEKADSQKMLQAIKKGVKPPNCKGKEECDVYCLQEEHFEECLNFAEAAGFMTSEEATMARKTGGKGPGDCKNKEECDAFCNDPANQETCFNFAKENGMISEEDLKNMEEGKQKFKESLEQAPPAVLECLISQLGTDIMEKFKSGTAMPPKEIGDKMQECFQKMGPPQGPGGPGEGGMMPPAGQAGPGGCQTAEECQIYCDSHLQECSNFQPMPDQEGQGGSVTGPTGNFGPGGCASQEECQTYCSFHPEECQQMQNQMMNPDVCQGENCQYVPPSLEQQPPTQQQPPAGENIPLPSQPPAEQQTSPENPPPPISNLLKSDLLLGAIMQNFIKILLR